MRYSFFLYACMASLKLAAVPLVMIPANASNLSGSRNSLDKYAPVMLRNKEIFLFQSALQFQKLRSSSRHFTACCAIFSWVPAWISSAMIFFVTVSKAFNASFFFDTVWEAAPARSGRSHHHISEDHKWSHCGPGGCCG